MSGIENFNRSELYFNRELSWLDFNFRVLAEASREHIPLFERLRFLSISASNLDEFYRVRVAGLKGQIAARARSTSIDGKTPLGQLQEVYQSIQQLLIKQDEIWRKLKEELKEQQIFFPKFSTLSKKEQTWLHRYFMKEVFPVLTPITVSATRPCPFIANGSIAIIASLKSEDKDAGALVVMPSGFDRFVSIQSEEQAITKYIALEDVIQKFLYELFPSWEIQKSSAIRILRDGDLELNDKAEDLVLTFESALKKRARQSIVNISHDHSLPKKIYKFITKYLDVDVDDITLHYHLPVGLADVNQLINNDKPDLLYPRFDPRISQDLKAFDGDIFRAMACKEWLLHHPYDSFDVVVQLLRQAAMDEHVIAIRHTLYRTSDDSPIVEALKTAAEQGKNVTAMIELKARFDEANNLNIAKELEEAGVQVIFGFTRLKTHSKLCHILRREGNKFVHYTHVGTGNYHPINAKIYTDLSYLTCNHHIGEDAIQIFNFITSQSMPQGMKRIEYAPHTILPTLLDAINNETTLAKQGKPAYIWAKMNALLEENIINALYEASQAGVKIRLNVRGICTLRPQVKGLSENIKVYSVIGRFLEHSRIFIFGSGHEISPEHAKIWIGSCDWMKRNLHRRIETMVFIDNIQLKKQIIDDIYQIYQTDNQQTWQLDKDGQYHLIQAAEGEADINCHDIFMQQAIQRAMPHVTHQKEE